MSQNTRSVLFVCLGNICRSPAGEAVFRHLVEERGLGDRVTVDSAGIESYHVGETPDTRMAGAARKRGYRLEGRARRFQAGDYAHFDLIVAMDRSVRRALSSWDPRLRHEEKLKLFSEFLPPGRPEDVPDPYYGGYQGFETVLDIVEEGVPAILDHLLGGPDEQTRA